MKKAIIYSAHGEQYIKDATQSAKETKKCIGDDISLILHTNESSKFLKGSPFDKALIEDKGKSFKKKPFAFRAQGLVNICRDSDFDRFLYLDTDAVIKKPEALGIFDLMDQFDIAVAHAPVRHAGRKKDNAVPDCFPEFNCGVILFKKTCLQVFEEWLNLYIIGFIKHPHDQAAFRRAVYFSDLRIATLTPEYNNRTPNENNCYIWHHRALLKR